MTDQQYSFFRVAYKTTELGYQVMLPKRYREHANAHREALRLSKRESISDVRVLIELEII